MAAAGNCLLWAERILGRALTNDFRSRWSIKHLRLDFRRVVWPEAEQEGEPCGITRESPGLELCRTERGTAYDRDDSFKDSPSAPPDQP